LWRQITLTHTVLAGAPEIGHPVGVGFYVRDDGAVDDATLIAQPVPEPGSAAALGGGGVMLLLRGRRRRRRRREADGP
jgi:hypothetical protein